MPKTDTLTRNTLLDYRHNPVHFASKFSGDSLVDGITPPRVETASDDEAPVEETALRAEDIS